MVRQAKLFEEQRVALVYHDNPTKFFVYINKQTPCAPLGPVFSFNGYLVNDD